MIVVHIDTQEDTSHLKCLYEGLEGVTLLYNPTRNEVENAVKSIDDKCIMFLGHGCSSGLFGTKDAFIIDGRNADLFKDKEIIGIWCYACNFAERYGLHGYFTSMFISNAGEASYFGFNDCDEQDIYNEIDVFCNSIRSFIDSKTEMKEWVPILHEQCHKEKPFVSFNYKSMKFFQ